MPTGWRLLAGSVPLSQLGKASAPCRQSLQALPVVAERSLATAASLFWPLVFEGVSQTEFPFGSGLQRASNEREF